MAHPFQQRRQPVPGFYFPPQLFVWHPVFVPVHPAHPVQNDRCTRVQINPNLAKGDLAKGQMISWDLWCPLDFAFHGLKSALKGKQHTGLSYSLLAESATTPPVPQLTIRISQFQYKGSVTVTAHRQYVTIGDVLKRLQSALQETVTPEELKAAEKAELNADVTATFMDRIRAHPNPGSTWQAAYRRGVKRIDFLLDHHHFDGFEVVDQKRMDHVELRLLVS
ncbi:uncharacterized protein FIBRA_08087 [Fibroporia radiculosa]|uniref:DUF6699 domain-containing protein n=1 Tax=Fibroporia radiculosa TaxID=599839 RepID=J4IC61_9APHY|nr:uncharacterized protein FIBRA_08087 [Fibroporia radiculosa]CCM05851.1 predicted protein [Fibroporia radiculosa]